MGKNRGQHGFTLVELLVALMVASVVLSAVAALAYATSSAKEATDDMGREQAQLRQVSMRLTDLIKQSNRLYRSGGGMNYAFEWGTRLCYDLNADGDYLDDDEMVWIYRDNNSIRVYRSTESTPEIYTQCTNPTFEYGWKDGRPRTVAIWFDMDDNGQTQRHSINATLRVSDDY